ncbi:uncharacterized protein LOC119112827 [Pollicipes pollicipes]|uniref:uncharacterized protein LOC119112827 n=1 Tax=Pollicipes pollicipes TaxID=41117 RepID=UPI001884BD78|nr:uncharacterized protein LOC119112827 [Pollicipes pollicipes]
MARLNQDRFAGGSLTVSYLSEGFNFDYGVDTNITLMTSSYALVAQVRRDDGTADLTFLASREVGSESRTVRLTAALGLDETDAHTLDASLDLPNYPSTRLSGRLAAGSGGRYLVSGQLQRGPHVYMISGQYRYEAEHVLELRARLPRREYTGTLSARTEGGNYKVKADLQLGRRIMTVVSVRPGGPEMNANFELFWNKDVDDSQHVIMEISRRGYDLSAKLRYPGRQVQLLAGLTSSGVRASLEYAPDKVILLEGRVAVQSNNKLALHLNIQTPLPGYRTLTLTFQNKPDVTGVPSLLNFKVAGNIEEKEVILNGRLVADFAMAQDDIQTANIMETELDLTTPFVGWERSRLELKYVQNATTFHARMDGSKNKDGLSLGANFEKTYLPKVFAVRTGLFFELPVDRVQSGALNLDFTIKDSYLDAKALAQWNGPELKTLELTVQSRHNLTSNVLVDSHVMLKTPFEKMHKLNSHFELRKNDTSLSSRFTATDGTGEELLITELKGLVFGNLGSFAGNFLFACDVCPTLGIAMECAKNIGNSQFNITTLWRNQEATLTGSSASTEGGVHEYALALHLPNPARRYHLKRAYHFDLDEKTIQDFWEVARDDQAVTVNLTANWNVDSNGSEMPTYSLNAFGQVRSPFEGWESSRISESCAITVTTSGVEYTNEIELHKGGRNILITERGHFRDLRSWQLDREVASNTGWFSHSTQHLRSDWTGSKGTVTCRVTWDEQTAELTYVDAAPAGHSSGYNVTLTAQWFGQRARRVSFLMVSSAKAWTPLITVSYAPGKTIKISGEIYRFSAASESHLTLEAPFTDVILLKTSHDIRSIRKRALLEVFHGQRAYSLQIDVDTDFRSAASFDVKLTSPTWFLGSNTLSLGYQLGSSFVMRGEVSHADWRLSLHSDMGRERGDVEVTTPFGGLKKMSFRYTISSKAVLLRAALGNSAILLTLNDESDYDMIEYSARLSTPYEGFRILTVVFSQPRGQKLFSLRCAYDRRNTISINGEYELSGPRSSVTVQIRTSFDALPAASLQLSYDLLESTASLQFARGRDTVKIEASADISLAMSSLTINYWNSLIAGPRRVTLTGAYDVQSSEKLLDMVLEKDSDVYFTRGRARLSTESSYVTLNAGTPLPGYEKLSIVSYLSLTSAGPALTFELTKNNATVQATFEVNVTGWSGTAVLDIETLFDDNRHITLAGKYEVLPSSASVELVATRDSIRKTIRGTMRLGDHGGDMSIITPFHGFETFDVEYSVARANNKREVEVILRRGQDEIQLLASGELSRSQPRIAIEVRTPMETAKTLSFNARYDIDSTAKVVHVTLARNNRRLELKISGEMHIDSAEAVLTLNTPFPSWENVKCSAMYDLRSAERKAEISYDRNGNKTVFSARSFYDAESAYLHVVTPFEGFESLGVSIRYANTRHKREVGYEAHVNEHRHRLYLLYERSGTDSIKLRMNTPIHDMHVVEVDLRRQSFSDGVGMYADLNLDGKHTSVELRTTLAKKTMGIDIYLKSHRKGFENVRISGSVNLAKKKKAFRLASQSKTQKIELSGFFAIKGKGGIGKLVSKLPLPGLEKVNVKVRYTLGKKNKFKLIYVKGKKKTQISGDLTYTDTSFTINLKTPFNGFQKIKANAGRTTDSDGTVSAELSLQRSNRAISVKYSYLFSLKKGDGSIEIATPYEGFEDMKMSLTYNNLAKSRNMKFTARRNSREWHIESSRSWGDGIEDGSLVLRSPLESIRSVKINRSFNIKNLEAMRYLASYERNDRKFVITGTGSIRQSGKEVSLDVTVETPLEIGQLSAKAGYDFTRMPMSLRSNLSAGPRYVNVEASLGATSGTVNVQATSGGRATGLDIDYTAQLGDRTREVSANLVMKDGRRLSVLYTADQSRPKTGSGTIKVDSTTFGDRELKWSFSYPDDDLTSSISYKAPNVQAEWSLSVQGTMLVHRKIIASSSINSPWHTSTTQVDVMFDRRNGLDLTADVSSNGRQYKLLIDKKSRGQMQVLSLSYDGHFAKNVKIDGTWSSLRGVDGRRSFEFTYSRGRQKASLSGSVQLGSAGKSGATSLHLTTPFAEAAVVKLEVTWNFISPNAILKAEYSRNGVSYLFVQSGSHHQQSGEYAVQISMPNVKVYNRKSFSGIEMIVSYDLSKGVHVKVHMDRPFESTVEVKFTKTRAATTLKLLLHFMDKLDLIPQINHRHFQLDYTSERRRVGPLIEATLATNVFDLGKVELSADIQKQDGKTIIDVDYKRGSKAAHILGEISRASGSGSSSFSLKTPISGYEDVSLSGGYQFSPGHEYALNIEYSRGQKFIHFDSSSTVSVKRAKGKLKSVSASADIQISSKITTPMQLSVTASSDIRDIGTPKQSGEGKVEGTLNGKKLGLTYSVERDDHGRRVGSVTITTPFKNPYKKIVLSTDVSLHSNKASTSIAYGPKKVSLQLSWFKGEANQYGAEVLLESPYAELKSLELEAKGTLNSDGSVDVLGHYRRNNRMVHVTGTVRRDAFDLRIKTPNSESFRVQGGVTVDPAHKTYSIRGLVTMPSGASAGGELTVKAAALNNMQLTVDVHTPLPGWERFNADVAYTDVQGSRVIRVAFESPQTKRMEVGIELTSQGGRGKTDLRAGITTNYLGSVFTFRTHIFRDTSGMKYELEIESPFHIDLPGLPSDH